MMVLQSTETHNTTLKMWLYLGLNSELPRVPIRQRDLRITNSYGKNDKILDLTELVAFGQDLRFEAMI